MAVDVRLIIVSGLSGSGKTVALHVLEDLGYYSIDHLPAALLKPAVEELTVRVSDPARLLAVGVDVRNRPEELEALPRLIDELRKQNVQTEVLFLQASDDVLLKRFSETRRPHPLASKGTALRTAIASERELLSRVIDSANLIIDTSRMSVYDLADAIRERIDRRQTNRLSVLIESFGFKNGVPADADFVFDLRCIPNPYWTPELRGLTGLDSKVKDFLDAQESFLSMQEDIRRFLQRWIPEYDNLNRGYLTIALGCTGGQHRSVYMAEKLADALRAVHEPVLTRHNELRMLQLTS